MPWVQGQGGVQWVPEQGQPNPPNPAPSQNNQQGPAPSQSNPTGPPPNPYGSMYSQGSGFSVGRNPMQGQYVPGAPTGYRGGMDPKIKESFAKNAMIGDLFGGYSEWQDAGAPDLGDAWKRYTGVIYNRDGNYDRLRQQGDLRGLPSREDMLAQLGVGQPPVQSLEPERPWGPHPQAPIPGGNQRGSQTPIPGGNQMGPYPTLPYDPPGGSLNYSYNPVSGSQPAFDPAILSRYFGGPPPGTDPPQQSTSSGGSFVDYPPQGRGGPSGVAHQGKGGSSGLKGGSGAKGGVQRQLAGKGGSSGGKGGSLQQQQPPQQTLPVQRGGYMT